MFTPTLKIVLFKGKTLSDGRHPIQLQVTFPHQGKTIARRISLGFSAYLSEWSKSKRFKPSADPDHSKNKKLRIYYKRGEEVVNAMEYQMLYEDKMFSFQEFKDRFFNKPTINGKQRTLLGYLDETIQNLKGQNRLGYANKFKQLKNILLAYEINESFEISKVDKSFLKKLEVYILNRENPRTGQKVKKRTAQFYMQMLRNLFTKAIDDDVIETKHYPFRNNANRKGYSFSHLKSSPKTYCLSDEELERLKEFDWKKYPQYEWSWHVLMFLYLLRGIPIADASRLTSDDISSGSINFSRVKTSSRIPNIPINEKRKYFLEYFAQTSDGYHLLDILHKGRHDTQQQEINRISKMTRKVNMEAKNIQAICGIQTKITTYVMRHTVSRIALEKHGIYFLKNMLGHASMETTLSYAKKLPAKEIAKIDDDL